MNCENVNDIFCVVVVVCLCSIVRRWTKKGIDGHTVQTEPGHKLWMVTKIEKKRRRRDMEMSSQRCNEKRIISKCSHTILLQMSDPNNFSIGNCPSTNSIVALAVGDGCESTGSTTLTAEKYLWKLCHICGKFIDYDRVWRMRCVLCWTMYDMSWNVHPLSLFAGRTWKCYRVKIENIEKSVTCSRSCMTVFFSILTYRGTHKIYFVICVLWRWFVTNIDIYPKSYTFPLL